MLNRKKFELSSEQLVLAVVAFQLCFVNASFWHRLAGVLGNFSAAPLIYISLFLLMLALMSLLYGLITPTRAVKPVLVFFLILAATTSYFMDNYGAVIDRHALQSAIESDARESMEWLSVSMLWPVLLLGVLPAAFIQLFITIPKRTLKRGVVIRGVFLLVCAAGALASVAYSYQPLASIARNHPTLRDLINPFNAVNAVRGYVRTSLHVESSELRSVGADAVRGKSWSRTTLASNAVTSTAVTSTAVTSTALASKALTNNPLSINAVSNSSKATNAQPTTLFVLVLGESTRAANFGLLGYPRNTTPELSKWPLFLFQDVSSCGTNTATSVPCMFSNLGRAHYDERTADSQENLLDIVKRAGIAVEWIDNNTGSKKVAKRMLESSVATDTDTTLCNSDGCHDEILIRELTKRLDAIQTDTVLVLHQLGSHGPAYFQRYPERFARFTPICKSVELHNCSKEELLNSYDNSVLYSDYVVAKMIAILAERTQLNTALMFVSDHGESTGESGYFLHGAPYAFAPKEQTQVPMFFWFSEAFKAQRNLQDACMQARLAAPTSHDALFPMLLGVLDISTNAYRAEADPFSPCYASGLTLR